MLANALYKRGLIKEGYEVIDSIYKMATGHSARIYPMIPEYFNNEGRGMYFYLTGSASWYTYTLMEEILGTRFTFGDILIAPRLINRNFFGADIEVNFALGAKKIKVIFNKGKAANKPYSVRGVFMGKTKIEAAEAGYLIRKEILKKGENTIRVYLV